MAMSRFTKPQKLSIIKQAESGVRVRKICCEHNISNATFYLWRRKFNEEAIASASR